MLEERVWGDGRHISLQTFHTCYGHGHHIQMRQCVVAAVLEKTNAGRIKRVRVTPTLYVGAYALLRST